MQPRHKLYRQRPVLASRADLLNPDPLANQSIIRVCIRAPLLKRLPRQRYQFFEFFNGSIALRQHGAFPDRFCHFGPIDSLERGLRCEEILFS